MSQFVAAFDGMFLYRYDKNGIPKEKINVRYINGSKQRALFDIVNPAKNITLPAISINRKNLKRDSDRVQHKDQHMYRHHVNSKNVAKIPMPIPVSCDIDVSIIAHYKEDIDQIVSNIIPYCNPYFIISWKVPEEFGMDFDDELRSEVSWSGSFDYEEPIEVDKAEKHRIIANTSFTIKGWIFPALETTVAPIYVVNNTFSAVGSGDDIQMYNAYSTLSGLEYTTSEMITISAIPEITNVFYNGIPIFEDSRLPMWVDSKFSFLGKRFSYNTNWYLSANSRVNDLVFEEIKTLKHPTISAYRIPDKDIISISDNIVSLSVSANSLSGFDKFNFIVSNEIGWGGVKDSFFLDSDPKNVFVAPDMYNIFLDPTGIYTFIAY